jgi:IS5 family transposase
LTRDKLTASFATIFFREVAMKHCFAIIVLSLLGLNAHAGVNKWVDAEGKVHYSDAPPPEAKTETVRNISGKGQTEAPATYSTKSYAEREAEMKKSKLEKEEASKKEAQKNAATEAKERSCEAARQHARALEEGARVYNYDQNGERVYLDDDTRAQRLEEARKTISADCN